MNAFLLINRSADLDLKQKFHFSNFHRLLSGGCSKETTHEFKSMRFCSCLKHTVCYLSRKCKSVKVKFIFN
jgi:hypothetical protein